MEKQQTNDSNRETYVKPEIREYGDLRELTRSGSSTGATDVPSGTVGEFIFSQH
jgi:hypothetical protein